MKQGLPSRWELVVCKITKLRPNSAEALLLEYGKPGMIHVSEVASRWVRDIREFLKENQYVVCRVTGVDDRGISLSMKKVRREEGSRKLNEFKRERKAGSMLEQVARSLKKTREQAFKEVGFLLQEEFGSVSKAFEMAVKNPELLEKKGVPKKWLDPIRGMAEKRFGGKTYSLRGELELSCPGPDGIAVIKDALLAARKKGFQVSYVSAPRYTISDESRDIKKLQSSIEEEGQAIVKAVQKGGGEGSFRLKE